MMAVNVDNLKLSLDRRSTPVQPVEPALSPAVEPALKRRSGLNRATSGLRRRPLTDENIKRNIRLGASDLHYCSDLGPDLNPDQ